MELTKREIQASSSKTFTGDWDYEWMIFIITICIEYKDDI